MSDNPMKKKDPFGELMGPIDQFFHKWPVKGFLQSIDELFQQPFLFSPSFAVDVSESENDYTVIAELPRVNEEQIKVNVLNQYVTIEVRSFEELTEEDSNRKVYKRQQSLQQTSRTIPLAYPVNEKMAKASFNNGLLKIIIPKQKGKNLLLNGE